MKKTLGVLIVAVCLLVAGFLNFTLTGIDGSSGSSKGGVYSADAASDDTGYFPGYNSQFRIFDTTSGVFILRNSAGYLDPGETFTSGAIITENSGANGVGLPFSVLYTDWRYEALLADVGGDWYPTDMLQVSVNAGRKSVIYSLPRAAPAGRYGIRATAYSGGEPVYDSRGLVSSIFVVMYAEELGYMYCADSSGGMVYNVLDKNKGLGRTFQVGIYVNPGAIKRNDLNEGDVLNVGNFEVGNLEGIGLSNLNWHFETVLGERFRQNRVVPVVNFVDGVFQISLPQNLSRGNYVLRVYHDINDEIFGTYVVSYGGVYKAPAGLANSGPMILIFGLVFFIGFFVMYMLPKMAARVNKMQYDMAERKLIKQRSDEILTKEYKGSDKRALGKEVLDKISSDERQRLFKQRVAEAKQTKSNKFLGKMAENRQKREIARDAGLTMEEFKEIENKIKLAEGAKEVSLVAFRKAVEDKTGIVTQKQEEEEEAVKNAGDTETHPKREFGEPEFDLLDSVKTSEEAVQEVEKISGISAAAPVPANQKWKQAIIQEDGVSSSIVDKNSRISDEKSAESGNLDSKMETDGDVSKSEGTVQQNNIPESDVPVEEKTEANIDKPSEEAVHNTDDKPGEGKAGKESMLQRLRRLAEEDNG